MIIIITLFVSFVLLLAGVGLSFTSSSPLSPFAFGKEEGKIKGLLGADDAGFLNPDEEESTKVSVEDEVEVHGKNEEEEEEEEEEEGEEEEERKKSSEESLSEQPSRGDCGILLSPPFSGGGAQRGGPLLRTTKKFRKKDARPPFFQQTTVKLG